MDLIPAIPSIGASSKDIKQTAGFKLAKEMVVEKDEQALAPQVAIVDLNGK